MSQQFTDSGVVDCPPSIKRILAVAQDNLEQIINNDPWDYYNWDYLLELEDEEDGLTQDELDWLERNVKIEVVLKVKS